MTKTEHYQLNQWDAADQVRRTDFNADNAKLDAAIKGVADTASAQTQTVAAKAATAPDVLARSTLAQAGDTITLSGLKNLGRYTVLRLLLWGQPQGDSSFCYLRVNGRTTAGSYSSRTLDNMVVETSDGMRLSICQTAANGGSVYDIRFYNAGGRILAHGCCLGYDPNGVTGGDIHGAVHFCGFSGVSSLSVTLGGGGLGPYPFAPGTTVILLGYKF